MQLTTQGLAPCFFIGHTPSPDEPRVADAADLRRLALALPGTTEAPHFDRTAFKVARIFATLAADGMTANLKLAPEEQEFLCMMQPGAFVPVPNAWGAQGWTTAALAALGPNDLGAALETAWRHAQPTKRKPRTAR